MQALDFFLSWKSHQSNLFYHLNLETIQNLTGDPNHDNALVKNGLDSSNQHAPVSLLISLGQNTYFFVLFDFAKNKALILGRHGPVTMDDIAVHVEWGSWDGPALWKKIGQAFNWMEEAQSMPLTYAANWIPVYIYLKQL